MSYDSFPQELKKQKQWVLWKLEKIPGKEKPTKVPYRNTAQHAKSNEPETWNTFEYCEELFNKFSNQFSGIGYVFKEGVIGIDLDHCFNEDRTLKQWAIDIIALFPSYIEISPSGQGLHILLLCNVDFIGKKAYINALKGIVDEATAEDAVERYVKGRFFTVTGNVYREYSQIKTFEPDFFLKWHNSLIKDKQPEIVDHSYNTNLPEDNKILEVMFKSKNGSKIKDLYNGDWQSHFSSQSEADLSFVGSLMFFCGNNTMVVDRIYRGSKLMRDKWERKDIREGLFEKCTHSEVMKWDNLKKDVSEKKTEVEWTPAISMIELLKKDFPEKKWAVENLFEKGTINQLSAPPQQWKTWTVFDVAISIATGEKLWGNFATEQQNVMIVNEEDPEASVRERLLLLLGGVKDLPIYIHADKGIKLEEEIVTKLLEEAEKNKIGFIIFDSLSVIHNAEENSSKEMGLVFEQMKRFSRRGITVLFTNHHRKKPTKSYQKDDIQEQTRGSTVINAVPSGHITCEEKIQDGEKFIIIRQAKLKGAKKIVPFKLKVEISESKISFMYAGEHEESLDAATKLRDELYEIIQKSEIWLGIKDFTEMVGKSESLIREQIKALLDKHIRAKTRAILVKEGAPVSRREKPSGQEFLYFRLKSLNENKMVF